MEQDQPHAPYTAVAIGGRALLIGGPPGSGKTSLALGLIDRGAQLIGDDAILLRTYGKRLVSAPPENIKGLIEMRNVGLVSMPCISAPVALVLELVEDAPRFVDQAGNVALAGFSIPMLRFTLNHLSDCIRAEQAMATYGLTW